MILCFADTTASAQQGEEKRSVELTDTKDDVMTESGSKLEETEESSDVEMMAEGEEDKRKEDEEDVGDLEELMETEES